MEDIIKGIHSADEKDQLIAVQAAVEMLLDCEASTIDLFITANVIPKLVDFLSCNNRDLLVGSVLAIQRITCGTAHQVKAIVGAAAISPLIALIALLGPPYTDIIHSAVITLANIALGGLEFRNRLFSEGIVSPLVDLIHPNVPEKLAEVIAHGISNLCLGADVCPMDKSAGMQLMTGLNLLIHYNNEKILVKVCSALCYLTDNYDEDYIQQLFNTTGMSERLFELFSSNRMTESPALPSSIVGIVCNITASTSSNCNIMVEKGIIAPTAALLNSPHSVVVLAAVYILTNVIQDKLHNRVIVQGAITPLLKLIQPNSCVELMKEVALLLKFVCNYNTSADLALAREILPGLGQLIKMDDDEIIGDVYSALSYLMSGKINNVLQVMGHIIGTLCIPLRLVELIGSNTTQSTELLLRAVRILEHITKHCPSHSKKLVDAGIVAPLVNLLVSPGGDVVIVAVGTLAKIFRNDPELRGCIVEAGVIAPLLDLIQPNASVELLREVALFFTNLCCYDTSVNLTVIRQIMPGLHNLIALDDDEIIALTCWTVSCLIEHDHEIREIVLNSCILHRLIELIGTNRTDNPLWLYNSLAILCNITGGTPEERKLLMDSGIVDPLKSLLRYPHSVVVLTAAKTFDNIVDSEVGLRDHIIGQGVISTVLELINPNANEDLMQVAAQFIKNVCRHVQSPLAVSVVNQLLLGIKYLIQLKDVDILMNISGAIYCLMLQRKQEFITGILESYCDFIPPLVQLMDQDDDMIMLPALNTIVQVVSNGSGEQKEMVLNSGVLPTLVKLLKHSHATVVKKSVFILLKVATETVAQFDALFTHKVVEELLNLLVNDNLQLKKTVTLAITRIVRVDGPKHIFRLWQLGAIAPICAFLQETEEPFMITRLLLCLYHILLAVNTHSPQDNLLASFQVEFAGGFRRASVLRNHSDLRIKLYSLAVLQHHHNYTSNRPVTNAAAAAKFSRAVFFLAFVGCFSNSQTPHH